MVQPIDYTLDVINPIQSAMQGFTGGMQLGTAMADRERALAQQQKDQLVKQQMNEDLFNLSQNPTHEGYVQVMTKYPQLSENLKRAYDTMDVGKQRTTLSLASQTYAALNGGNAEIAKQVLEDGALAYENSGNKQDASVLRGYKKMIENNPKAAKTSIGMLLASTNPDKFADIFGKLGDETRANELQPIVVAQGNANVAKTKADTAKTNAETTGQIIENKYKPQKIEADLENVDSQISSRKANAKYQQQQLFFEKNKPVDFGVDKQGRKYAVISDGTARYVKDVQGNYITDIKSEKPMTATMQKELFETDDAIASSQSVISNLKEALRLSPISYDGVNADTRASIAGNLGLDKDRAKNTIMLNNIMTSNALDALKSTFGAAPTEGERKILLDIQGSVNLPAKQREAIYTRALQAAEKRLNTNQKKAEAIRGGSYTSSEYNNATAPQQQQTSKPVARSFFD